MEVQEEDPKGEEEEEEKSEKIASWLKKIFGDQPIPKYEMNPRTTDILYHLSECNRVRDRDTSLVIEDLKQKAREYESEARYLQDLLLESVNLSFTSLSSIGSSYLNALVDIALVLETKDTSLARNEEMEHELSKLGKNLTATLMLEKCLREDLKKAELHLSMEKAKVDSRISNMDFLKAKSDDLRLRIKIAEEQLSARGMDASLSHQSLLTLSERCKTMETLYILSDSMEVLKLAELKQQTAPLKKRLESYLDLMPNPSLAQVKIEEAKRELNSVDAELTMKVDMMELLPDQNTRVEQPGSHDVSFYSTKSVSGEQISGNKFK
ncbi:HAUS augmin-like complex subunit 1 isoform X3 [Monodelphis domestica]|uniref:HAUS augmin-like complex subunit 1 isoform X3 n=1 Tax=Monodelphis domestica TaxID=13616 RepID=UPI0024E1A0E9|nr:HAUS augmin-like complex subunit 1 isoform X3 [Monodelphis domestica]